MKINEKQQELISNYFMKYKHEDYFKEEIFNLIKDYEKKEQVDGLINLMYLIRESEK